ncbi:hypothetical protein OPQ81_002773 [Rhizoctonia solani]|nr:hypothetical protein OPQ81_002773 [Rhizoctonia solani]
MLRFSPPAYLHPNRFPPTLSFSTTSRLFPFVLGSYCQLVQYNALGAGIFYGIFHRRTLQTRLDNERAHEEEARHERLVKFPGFGYDFHSLEQGDNDELARAYTEIFNSNRDISSFIVMKGLICLFLRIPTKESRIFDANQAIVQRVGTNLVRDKRALLKDNAHSEEFLGQDLLTPLIKSNLDETDSRQAMSDEEVLGLINFHFPCCGPRNCQFYHVMGIICADQASGGAKEAP